MKLTKIDDIKFGLQAEIKLAPLLEANFGKLYKTPSRWDLFDFINDDTKTLVEVKSRRCSSTQYASTMIGYNKFNALKEFGDDWNVYFVFNFTDGVFYCDPRKIKNMKVSLGGFSARSKVAVYCYIPVKELTEITYLNSTTSTTET